VRPIWGSASSVVPRVYLTPFIRDFDIGILAIGTYFAVINWVAMTIFTAGHALLVFPIRIAVVSEDGRNEKE
jgi:hypothetical protein